MLALQLIALFLVLAISLGVVFLFIVRENRIADTRTMLGIASVIAADRRVVAAVAGTGEGAEEIADAVERVGAQRALALEFVAVADLEFAVLARHGEVPDGLRADIEAAQAAGWEDDVVAESRIEPSVGLDGTVNAIVPLRVGPTVVGFVAIGMDARQSILRAIPLVPAVIAFEIGTGGVATLALLVLAAVHRKRLYKHSPIQVATALAERDTIIRDLVDGLIAVDAAGRISVINPEACRLTGLTEGVRGLPMADVAGPDLLPVLAGPPRLETIIMLRDLAVMARRDDIAGGVDGDHGYIVLLRDRSEIATLIDALDGAESLADGLRTRAHEFTGSLHVIAGLLDLGLHDEAQGYLREIGGVGARSALVAESRLAESRLDGLLRACDHRADEVGVRFTVMIAPDVEELLTDGEAAQRLRDDVVTVSGNLVSNALEACVYGDSIQYRLVREPDEDGGGVSIEVDDDGPGVPPAIRERLFELGVSSRNETSRDTPRGTGLALVQRIAARNHGSAALVSKVGSGAVIRVRLRARAVAAVGAEPWSA